MQAPKRQEYVVPETVAATAAHNGARCGAKSAVPEKSNVVPENGARKKLRQLSTF